MLQWIVLVPSVAALIAVFHSWLMKKDLRDLTEQLKEKLSSDTNVSLYVSGRNQELRAIASELNFHLDLLRKQQLQYHNGNIELKNAVTNISHDIRTPLTAIYGYLDMIQKTDDHEKQAKYISIMKDRAEHMKQLTEELFRYSVIISDESEMETEEVFINQALAESISGFYPVLSDKGITPDINITDIRIIRNVNKAALSRVFANLLNNVLKYSDGDLEITLSDTGEIAFSNTAKELSAVEVEQLFDRFYTVEAARHSTGLGLSIARTLVERMGGKITAEYHNSKLTIKIVLQ